jgi:hypothetical protein
MLGNRRIISSVVIALAVALSLPVFAGAETWNNSAGDKPHPEVAQQLKTLKGTAMDLHRQADKLQSYSMNSMLSWRTHSDQQTLVKEHINQLGKMLAELENQKHVANENQRLAIEQVRPHLVGAAQNLTQAMELVNDDRINVRFADYADAVSNLYDHSEMMSEKLDTILDYENSRLRLESLELQPVTDAPSPTA